MNRLVFAALGIGLSATVLTTVARAQSNADLLVRIDHLESQMRQLTGLVEQLQYRNQQLEAALRRDDAVSSRQSATSATISPRSGLPSAGALAPPAAVPPGRRSDAFDPAENPGAPGVPRTLGSIYAGAASRSDGSASNLAEDGRPSGAPLDLTTMSVAAGTDPVGGRPPVGSGSVRAAPGSYAVATAPPSSSPRDTFDLGYGYLQRKDYALAEESFRDFLRRYPADRLSADAQYWMAESLYQRQSYRDAADAFLVVSKKYENSVKAPDALLRLGQSLAAISEKELACATFGEVGRKYPRVSPSVKQAVEREQKRVQC